MIAATEDEGQPVSICSGCNHAIPECSNCGDDMDSHMADEPICINSGTEHYGDYTCFSESNGGDEAGVELKCSRCDFEIISCDHCGYHFDMNTEVVCTVAITFGRRPVNGPHYDDRDCQVEAKMGAWVEVEETLQ